MTSIGLFILDCFDQSLLPQNRRKSPRLSNRDVYILTHLYALDEPVCNDRNQLAEELGLTRERIRQLEVRALKKISIAAKRGNGPASKIIKIIDKYVTAVRQNDNKHQAVFSLWLNEMPGASPAIITLLARLFFGKKEDIRIVREYYQGWKRNNRNKLRRERRKYLRDQALKDDLLKGIVWFELTKIWRKENFEGKEPKRKVNHNERYYSGLIKSDKCNRLVQYESNVERAFIEKLEKNPAVIYYLEQPFVLKYTKFKIDRQYTPDFAVLLEDGRCFIVEVKYGFDDMLDSRLHQRMEALIEYCEKYGFGLLLTNGKHSLNYLINYPCNPEFEKVIKTKLSWRGDRAIYFKEFKELILRYSTRKTEFLSLVLKNKWGYCPFPFQLTARNSYPEFWQKVVDKLAYSYIGQAK